MSIDYAVLIQARMGSSRAPGKVSHRILGKEMLFHQISRLKINGINNIIIATTKNKTDDAIKTIAETCEVNLFRGSENNVLERFYMAAKGFQIKNIIRVGGDDPLVDPNCINALIKHHKQSSANFIYASHKQGWIYGTAAELIEFKTLEAANMLASSSIDKEHVVTYIKDNPQFSQVKISPENKREIRPDIYLSVDYQEDLDLIEEILMYFSLKKKLYTFTQSDLIDLYDGGKLNIKNRHLHEGFS